MTFEEYEEEVKKVTKEEVIEFAKKVNMNTVFFLKN